MHVERSVLITLGVSSAVMFVGSLIALPFMIARAPVDFFTRDKSEAHPLWMRVLRNVFGFALILGGIAMLLLPGQGVLTLLLGVCLADFPGKRRIVHAILRRDSVWNGLTKLRTKLGREPFERPAD